MAHEIMEHDGLVLHEKEAWHGLGLVVEEAPTPMKARHLARLDFDVEQHEIAWLNKDGKYVEYNPYTINIRSDVQVPLGVVRRGEKPIQTLEMAEFAEALAEEGDVVKVESAGSIRNGQKVWFLLKGESFSVRGDENIPYICISTAYNSAPRIRCTPTTIRVVCSNTLHMVIPNEYSPRRAKIGEFSFSRSGRRIMSRLNEARKALKLYTSRLEETKKVLDGIASKEVKTREQMEQFFLECYTHDFGPIPADPKTNDEVKARETAMTACNKVFERFDNEKAIVGTNFWAAVNSYTGWLQSDRPSRLKDIELAKEMSTGSRLFGSDATRTHHALQIALSA